MAEDSRQVDAVIAVTPAMIDAGLDFYIEWDSDYFEGDWSPRYLMSEIFRRMLNASEA